MCFPARPVRAQIPAVFRKYYKTAGIAPLNQNIKNRKGLRADCVCKEPLIANFVRVLPDGQERGVEDAAGFVGLLAFVSELGLDVVPPTKLVSVLPARRELRDGTPVHEARDALEVGLAGSGIRHIRELLPVGHLDLHETSPSLRVGHHRSAVAVAVDLLRLLPASLVGEFDRGGVGQLGLDLLAMCTRLLLGLRPLLLPFAFVLGLDTSVARLLLVRENGVRVGADALADVAAQRPRPVAIDELGVGIRAHADGHAIELELDRALLLRRKRDGFGDGTGDVGTCHDVKDAIVFLPQVFHDFSPVFGL